jgi:hypothetical protein
MSLILVAVAGLCGLCGILYYGGLVAVLVGVTFWEFCRRIDQGLPLMQVAAVLAVMQWLVGPWLTYNVPLYYSTYDMRVEEAEYYAYALPATSAFVLGLLMFGVSVRQKGLLANLDRSNFVEIGIVLSLMGFLGGFLMGILPTNVAFLLFLISQLKYVGSLYFLFSTSSLKWLFAVISVAPLFTGSAESGLFHDLVLWIGILICYWYATEKRRTWVTLSLLTVGSLLLLTLQGVKRSYRDKVWNGESGSMLDEFGDFWADPKLGFSDDTLANMIIRVNQGWIVAAIIYHVPQIEPYADGKTLSDSVIAALVPRVFYEGKASAGGQQRFRQFTGLPISDNTSMGLSTLGEAYANFGPRGGLPLMFFLGIGLTFSYGLCLRFSLRHVTFYFWIPIIFCQVIKAETDLVTILNHISKGSVVAIGMYWLICLKLFGIDSAGAPAAKARDRSVGKRRFLPGAVAAGETSKARW